eukprot:SM000085S23275  [mRNA]  locus=s85:524480:525258:+ [translate_table: standard]
MALGSVAGPPTSAPAPGPLLLWTPSRVTALLAAAAFALVLYIVAPALHSRLADAGASRALQQECPPCSAAEYGGLLDDGGLIKLPLPDCDRNDRDWQEELEKTPCQALKEEWELAAHVAEEAQLKAENAYLDAKRIASQYQKEAEKCSVGMETSEEAREKAEAALAAAQRLAAVWEHRARDLGWLDKEEGAAEQRGGADDDEP